MAIFNCYVSSPEGKAVKAVEAVGGPEKASLFDIL